MSENENDQVGQEGLSRRKMIQRTAAAGAVVWSTPVIMASPAGAADAVTSPGGGEEPDCVNFRVFSFKYEVGPPKPEDTTVPWRTVTDGNGVILGRFVPIGPNDCINNDEAPDTPTGTLASACANQAFVQDIVVTESTDETVELMLPSHCDLEGSSAVAKEGNSCDYEVDDEAALANNVLVFEKEGTGDGVSNVQVRVLCCADDYLLDCPNGV